MKKLVFLTIFFVGFLATVFLLGGNASRSQKEKTADQANTSPQKSIVVGPAKTSIFVPYWSLTESDSPLSSPPSITREIDTAIYFSVSATTSGLNTSNAGYTNIEDFLQKTANSPHKLLTISMVDDSVNNVVLENNRAQTAIMEQAVALANQHQFDGIILDLEVGGFAGKKVNTQILQFVERASQIVKKQNLSFAITLYGDSFYRNRPYSIELLSPHVDQFYVMAYDFHKLWGTPGPGFPMKGRDTFGYDMETMVSDLLKFTSADKITVIFGLYGHDWTVDVQKRPFSAAKTLTLDQIQHKFIDSCEWKNCLIKRNPYAAETEINYIDDEQHYHIVWFEDGESVAQKIGLLKEFGINSISYWAYSYY